LACAPAAADGYTLGIIADGGWLGSTGRSVNCPVGPTGGANYVELHCITLGSTPARPTGTGNLTSAVRFSADLRGVPNPWLTGKTPPTSVLRIDGYYIPADILDGTRRIILCPDAAGAGDGIITSADLGATAAAFGKSVSNPGTPPNNYTTK